MCYHNSTEHSGACAAVVSVHPPAVCVVAYAVLGRSGEGDEVWREILARKSPERQSILKLTPNARPFLGPLVTR